MNMKKFLVTILGVLLVSALAVPAVMAATLVDVPANTVKSGKPHVVAYGITFNTVNKNAKGEKQADLTISDNAVKGKLTVVVNVKSVVTEHVFDTSVDAGDYRFTTANGAICYSWEPLQIGIIQVIKAHVSWIDDLMKAHLQAIMVEGIAMGRAEKIGQFGDSITESRAYLSNFIWDNKTEDGYDYAPIVRWMSNQKTGNFDSSNNLYVEKGDSDILYGNRSGWQASDWLSANANNAIINKVNPSWALIMFGTNECNKRTSVDIFEANLTAVVQANIDAGVIPVISTIPPIQTSNHCSSFVPQYNKAIVGIAANKNIPYVDLYGLFLAVRPNDWETALMGDDLHPNNAGITTNEALRESGYGLRSLLTAEMAEKFKYIVFDDGAPDQD